MLSKALISLVFWLAAEAQIRTLALKIERSEVNFSIQHMGFLTVEGTFREFESTLTLKDAHITQIDGEIQVASIETNETTRDENLKGPGYLDAEHFPTISFRSRNILKHHDNYQITGDLTIKSQQNEVMFPCQVTQKGDSIILVAQLVILRSEFKLDFGAMDTLIGDEITVAMKLFFGN